MEFLVGIGGAPTVERFVDLAAAEARCWELAREKAAQDGVDESDLELYGDWSIGGWGVCPSGDEGAYWPAIWIEGEREDCCSA
jgi:hypothetical protein